MGCNSSVSKASRHGLEGPGIESSWGKIFCTLPDRSWFPPSLLYNGYRLIPRGIAAGVALTTHPI